MNIRPPYPSAALLLASLAEELALLGSHVFTRDESTSLRALLRGRTLSISVEAEGRVAARLRVPPAPGSFSLFYVPGPEDIPSLRFGAAVSGERVFVCSRVFLDNSLSEEQVRTIGKLPSGFVRGLCRELRSLDVQSLDVTPGQIELRFATLLSEMDDPIRRLSQGIELLERTGKALEAAPPVSGSTASQLERCCYCHRIYHAGLARSCPRCSATTA